MQLPNRLKAMRYIYCSETNSDLLFEWSVMLPIVISARSVNFSYPQNKTKKQKQISKGICESLDSVKA